MLQKSIPTLKTRLFTLVDGYTPQARLLAHDSKLGKRRLFRRRVWAETIEDGYERVKFMPDWVTNLPSGRPTLMQSAVIPAGTLPQFIEQVQEQYGVHLWLAPIKIPTVWPRGNWYWPGLAPSTFCLADVIGQYKTGAVAA